jgi:hypothetical protein
MRVYRQNGGQPKHRQAEQLGRQEALPPGAQLQPAQALPTLHILDIQYLLLPRYAQVARVVAKAAAAGAAGASEGSEAGEQQFVGEDGPGGRLQAIGGNSRPGRHS